MTENWYINDQVFATGEFKLFGRSTDCCSLAYVCPQCGVLWGRDELIGRPWMAASRNCEAHGGGHFLGDFTLDQLADGRQWDEYPPKLLGYEVALLLKERQNGRSSDIEPTPAEFVDGGEGAS